MVESRSISSFFVVNFNIIFFQLRLQTVNFYLNRPFSRFCKQNILNQNFSPIFHIFKCFIAIHSILPAIIQFHWKTFILLKTLFTRKLISDCKYIWDLDGTWHWKAIRVSCETRILLSCNGQKGTKLSLLASSMFCARSRAKWHAQHRKGQTDSPDMTSPTGMDVKELSYYNGGFKQKPDWNQFVEKDGSLWRVQKLHVPANKNGFVRKWNSTSIFIRAGYCKTTIATDAKPIKIWNPTKLKIYK